MGGRSGDALKPAADSQTPAQVVETTTRRRILSVDQESKTPELWDYLSGVELRHEWDKHIVYLHRMEPSAPDGSGIPVQKCQQYLTMPDGQQVPVFDREEVELAILKHYGGKTFRLMVKRGPQLVTRGTLFIDAAPRTIVPSATITPGGQNGGASVRPIDSGNGDTAVVASRAFDALSNQERTLAEIGFRAMSTAAEVMQRFANPAPSSSSSEFMQIMQQMMAVMMQRMMQPPPDPLDLLTKLLALQASLNPASQPNEMMKRVMDVAIEKILNPAAAAPGTKLDMGAALVQMMPTIGSQFVEGLRAFATAREAEARIVSLQRGQPVMQPQPNPQLIPPSASAAAPAATNGAPSMEFIEQKILDFMRMPISAEEAADNAMTFLETLDKNAVGELAKLGESGLVTFFQSRPILKQATNNMPRLLEFIRAFLRMYAEDQAQDAAQAAQAPKQTLPN